MYLRASIDFTSPTPPPGYVPGIGRGAIGFMTRSDIGPARANPELAAAGATASAAARPSGVVPGAASAAAPSGATGGSSGPAPADVKFDAFTGYQERLFSDTPYDADDQEADRVYAQVDERMDARTKRRREQMEADAAKDARMNVSRIGDEFVDLKQQLQAVTPDQWLAIPDIGDRSLRYKAPKWDSFTPVPDAIIEARRGGGIVNAIDAARPAASVGGTTSTAGLAAAAAGGLTDIRGLSDARGQVLSLQLDKMSDSVSGQTVVDPKGYLTSLGSSAITAEADIEDVKKARLLLKSVITTNPKHGPGWIAAARLEEQVRNITQARKLIKEGCENCPLDEDVWIEAARLQPPAYARVVLADAVKHLPNSVNLWLRAAEMEQDVVARKAVLRKALTLIPNSEKLWKAAVSLEGPDDAKLMLARAVECVPTSVDMWLALARLETYENAQKVLNQAREAVPTDAAIWIAAAKLEEARGRVEIVARIIARALKSLIAQQVIIDREAWFKHAEDSERAESPATAAAIVKAVLDVGVDDVDRKRTWLADAQAFADKGVIQCARAVYDRTLELFSDNEGIWLRAVALEKKHGTPASVDALLERGYTACRNSETLWLMAAKDKWLAGDVDAARTILRNAFASNPDSSQIWLAAAKLEWESDEFDRARALLTRAREAAPGPRVWMKSAMLEREVGSVVDEEKLLMQGVGKFPTAPKLWLMLGQLHQRVGAHAKARDAFHAGLRHCPTNIPLWISACQLEEQQVGPARARTLLETARLRNAANPQLWLESIRLERRAGNEKIAEALMAKALQECPTSGLLLAEDLLTAPKAMQKRKSQDAIKKVDNDPIITAAVARLFWQDRKYENARKWFNRAVTLDADYGDAWIAYYAFEQHHGSPESVAMLEARCTQAAPAHGERWQSIAKKVENRRCSKLDILKAGAAAMHKEDANVLLWEQKPAMLGATSAAPPAPSIMETNGDGGSAAAASTQ